jgi:hypothetical protein
LDDDLVFPLLLLVHVDHVRLDLKFFVSGYSRAVARCQGIASIRVRRQIGVNRG